MRRERAGGFTLVELLVALLLFALLSAALFAALRIGAATANGIAAGAEDLAGLASARQVIATYLAGAYPQYIAPAQPGLRGHIYFDGEPHALAFLGPAPQSLAPGGLAVMQLAAAGTAPAASLTLSARPELAWPNAAATRETLLTGMAAAGFAYLGADDPNGPVTWHDRWTNRAYPPLLIRIQIIFPPGDGRNWPDLLIAPKIHVDEACQFVVLTQSCLGR